MYVTFKASCLTTSNFALYKKFCTSYNNSLARKKVYWNRIEIESQLSHSSKVKVATLALRSLFNYPCEKWQRKYIDIFKLTFFLIGINLIGLCRLTNIVNGYIVYNRAKTHRLYNIKVEPKRLK